MNRTLVESSGDESDEDDGGSSANRETKKTYIQLDDSVNYFESEKGLLELDKYSRKRASSYLSAFSTSRRSSMSTISSGVKRCSEISDVSSDSTSFSSNLITASRGDLRVFRLRNPRYVLPAHVDEGKVVDVVISEVVECGRFWAQMEDSPRFINVINKIHNHLNSQSYRVRKIPDPVEDSLCATYYTDNETGRYLYRARIR